MNVRLFDPPDDRFSEHSFADMLAETLVPRGGGPATLDLFAGCGGLGLGFESQGFQTTGFESVEAYARTYRRNLHGACSHVVLGESTDLPSADVVIAGPPCQPFSVGGRQRGLKDTRDGFPAFIAAIERARPEVFLFENVRGLFYRNRWYLDEIIDRLRALDYQVDVALLNAKHYGVPQNRERVIAVGHRGGFSFPHPIDGPPVTASQALGDLMHAVPAGSKFLTPSMDAYVERYEIASKCVRPRDLHPDRPARTLTCRNLAGATGDMHRVRLPDGRRRRLLVAEGARLQSFPDWFTFEGSETDQFNQVGNAVPPLLAYHLAGAVRDYLTARGLWTAVEPIGALSA